MAASWLCLIYVRPTRFYSNQERYVSFDLISGRDMTAKTGLDELRKKEGRPLRVGNFRIGPTAHITVWQKERRRGFEWARNERRESLRVRNKR